MAYFSSGVLRDKGKMEKKEWKGKVQRQQLLHTELIWPKGSFLADTGFMQQKKNENFCQPSFSSLFLVLLLLKIPWPTYFGQSRQKPHTVSILVGIVGSQETEGKMMKMHNAT